MKVTKRKSQVSRRPRGRGTSQRRTVPSTFPAVLVDAWYEQLAFLNQSRTVPQTRYERREWLSVLGRKCHPTLKELWRSYNSPEHRTRQKRVAEAQSALAYVLGFHLNNLQRTLEIFQRLEKLKLFDGPPAHLLDIGCGAGAWAQGALYSWRSSTAKSSPEIDLIDRSRFLLNAAEVGLRKMDHDTPIRFLRSSLHDEKAPQVLDKIVTQCQGTNTPLWIGMSYMWNELKSQPRSRQFLANWLSQRLDDPFPVLLFFAEPGREHEAREAQSVRHQLHKLGFSVVYPCPSSHRCPMIKTPENWCYSEVPDHHISDWQPIATRLQVKRKVLATATYIFANPAAVEFYRLKGSTRSIVVGRPTVGKFISLLCCNGEELKRDHHKPEGTPLRGTDCPVRSSGSSPAN